MPPFRARSGCAIAAAAISLFAASRARSDGLAHADVAGGSSDARSDFVGDAGTDFTADEVEVPLARNASAPAAPTTTIDLDRFAGEQSSVAELLAASPGTTIRATGGPLQTATISLRGASADESLVLLDGIPLHGPGGGAFDLSAIPAGLISQLVVHRGVLGAQLGAGALGGALEIIPRGAGDASHGGITASYGSFNTAQVAIDGSGGQGSALEGFTGGLQLDGTSGNFRYLRNFTPSVPDAPLIEEPRENDDAKRLGFLARDERQLGSGIALDLIALGSFGDVGLPGPIGGFTPTARSDDQGGILGARLRMLEGAAVVSVRAWGQADRIVLTDFGGAFTNCASAPSDPSCAAAENHSLAARGSGEVAFPIGGANWATASLEGGEDFFAGAGAGVHRRGVGSLAVRDELSLLGGALVLHPAARFDAVGSDLAASPALAISAHPFSGPLQPLELRASGGTSFRPPTFSELYLNQGAIVPNAGLRPERAGSIDLGASWKSSRLTLAASIFWSRYRDLILYQLSSFETEKPYNIGEARILGAELEALLALPLGFTAEVSWSYLDAVDEEAGATIDGNELPYRPPQRLFARLARHGDRLEGFAQLGFSSSVPRDEQDTTFLPSQLTIDCGAGARVAGPLWVDLELKNALNDETLQDLFLYPLPGVSLTAIARARF